MRDTLQLHYVGYPAGYDRWSLNATDEGVPGWSVHRELELYVRAHGAVVMARGVPYRAADVRRAAGSR